MRWLSTVGALSCLVVGLHAQATESPGFEVASVKPITARPRGLVAAAADQFVRSGITLRSLRAYAYDRPARRVVGGPPWIDDQLFAINAKAAAPVRNPTQMTAMVRRLIADRFGLVAHEEARQADVYVMTVTRPDGRLGQHLRPAAFNCTAFDLDAPGPNVPRDDRGFAGCGVSTITNSLTGTLTGQMHGFTMARFARMTENQLGRPIVDRTGLTGQYDIDLTTARGDLAQLAANADAPVSPIVAIAEQLGLTLKAERDTVPFLVIDDVKKPMPD
jgi:uncharacterized protein (TIGR03435 family)